MTPLAMQSTTLGSGSDRASLVATSSTETAKCEARRSLFYCAVVLCLSPIAGGWLVDHCPPKIRFNEAGVVLERWQKADPPPNVMLLGSSRLRACVVNERLEHDAKVAFQKEPPQIFNAAVGGGEPVTVEMLLNQLFAMRPIMPRLAVIEASPDFLGRRNIFFRAIITRQLTTADLPRYALELVRYGQLSRLLSSRLLPFYRHHGELLEWAADVGRGAFGTRRSAAQIDAEWRKGRPPPAGKKNIADELTLFSRNLQNYQTRGATADAFERVIARLRSAGCEVAVVEPPFTSVHRALFSPQVSQTFRAFIARLQQTYGFEFFDFAERFPDEYFFDSHHINDEGRPRATDLIADEVITPMWRRMSARPVTSVVPRTSIAGPVAPNVHRSLH